MPCLRSSSVWFGLQWRGRLFNLSIVRIIICKSTRYKNINWRRKIQVPFFSPIISLSSDWSFVLDRPASNHVVVRTVNQKTSCLVPCFHYHVEVSVKQTLQSETENSDSHFCLRLNFLLQEDYHMVLITGNEKRSVLVYYRVFHKEVDAAYQDQSETNNLISHFCLRLNFMSPLEFSFFRSTITF